MRLSLSNFLTNFLSVMSYLHGLMGPCGSSLTMDSCRIGPRVLKNNLAKNPNVDAFNRVPGMAQATHWVSLLDNYFATHPDPSKLYRMCAPYHGFSDFAQKNRQEKLRAIVVRPK